MKFKVDDKVVCVNDHRSCGLLNVGDVYTIEMIDEYDNEQNIWLRGVGNRSNFWFPERFELVDKNKKFKVGDKVVCIDDSGINGRLIKDNVYTIEIIEDVKYGQNVWLKGVGDLRNEHDFCMSCRFKLASEESKFKVGDKVKPIVEKLYNQKYPRGVDKNSVGIITEINEKYNYAQIKFSENIYHGLCLDYLTLIYDLKVGDVVKPTKEWLRKEWGVLHLNLDEYSLGKISSIEPANWLESKYYARVMFGNNFVSIELKYLEKVIPISINKEKFETKPTNPYREGLLQAIRICAKNGHDDAFVDLLDELVAEYLGVEYKVPCNNRTLSKELLTKWHGEIYNVIKTLDTPMEDVDEDLRKSLAKKALVVLGLEEFRVEHCW
jgi:hypothetical protein